MRIRRSVVVLFAVAALAGCGGGAAARTYPTKQAYRIVAACMRKAGATRERALAQGGEAVFGSRGDIQWGYVMSAGKVADLFDSDSLTANADAIRAELDSCLKPYGWSVS